MRSVRFTKKPKHSHQKNENEKIIEERKKNKENQYLFIAIKNTTIYETKKTKLICDEDLDRKINENKKISIFDRINDLQDIDFHPFIIMTEKANVLIPESKLYNHSKSLAENYMDYYNSYSNIVYKYLNIRSDLISRQKMFLPLEINNEHYEIEKFLNFEYYAYRCSSDFKNNWDYDYCLGKEAADKEVLIKQEKRHKELIKNINCMQNLINYAPKLDDFLRVIKSVFVWKKKRVVYLIRKFSKNKMKDAFSIWNIKCIVNKFIRCDEADDLFKKQVPVRKNMPF